MRLWQAVLVGLGAGVLLAGLAIRLAAIPVAWAVALAVPVAAVVALAMRMLGTSDITWQPAPPSPDTVAELQASLLAGRLDRAADHPGRFHTLIQPRLRRLAVAVLRGRQETAGLSGLDDPRARAALGDELYGLLTDSSARPPSPRRLAELLDRLEGR